MLPRDHRRAAGEARAELADIFRQYGERYCRIHPLPASHRKVMRAVSVCRTAELGGHLKQCDTCGFEHPSYNSCRNRHCPKCQSLAQAKWLEKQTSELLPVGYFHLVFTLPHELNRLILAHKKILLALLFKAVSETLLEFGQRRFGATLGIIAVLHTWDQTLKDHFHLHCLVPGGALSFDHHRWVSARKNFLFSVTALSQVFRGKFLDLLKQTCDKGKIPAVSYRDRQDGDRKKTLPLDAHEFIRRFLLHVLPEGFMRIRHFGFLANRSKKQALTQCRKLLKLDPALPQSPNQSALDLLREITGVDLSRCPCCHKGTMIVVGELPRTSSSPRWDSS